MIISNNYSGTIIVQIIYFVSMLIMNDNSVELDEDIKHKE